jgi:hypothetical protein
MHARSLYFGLEFPSTFPQREREKERTAWEKTRIYYGMISG